MVETLLSVNEPALSVVIVAEAMTAPDAFNCVIEELATVVVLNVEVPTTDSVPVEITDPAMNCPWAVVLAREDEVVERMVPTIARPPSVVEEMTALVVAVSTPNVA